jgi:hypothetical protein
MRTTSNDQGLIYCRNWADNGTEASFAAGRDVREYVPL